ncbi:chemotaxis protein CheA [Roseomonas sp. GC11]|uniref:chemotaxis protein CheA n=1 Tax=Roseomonas sp. GC11 TaxID=2950546 RepID=UPI00210B896D|nr:chemotaxis protein CheA [Roseomonas sp. GC11]MCQ4159453.1 chemotaxis protein CheA [Roseomonas sp. GC11]
MSSGPDPVETFRQESQELLEHLEQALLDLEHRPGDMELIDSAFRALHTIKGSGAMFGFDVVAGFTHHVENAFDEVRKGRLPASDTLVSLALRAKDHLRILLTRPETADSAAGAAILEGFRAITGTAAGEAPAEAAPGVSPPGAPPPGAAAEQAGWRLRFRLARDAMAMGSNPLLLLDELRSLGPAEVVALADVPPLDALDPTALHTAWEIMLHAPVPRARIEEVFLFVIDDMELALEPLGEPLGGAAEPAPPAHAPAGAPQAGAPQAGASQTGASQPGKSPAGTPQAALSQASHPPAAGKRDAAQAAESVRVPAFKLDELMDRVGELVIAQSRLRQVAHASSDLGLRSVAEEIERLALELRDTTMGIRTVPIVQLFGRFRRLVHDISRDLGKEVELLMQGEETELDKTVIERLNDPLVHLIRNSLDHGLERPEERGDKPRRGRLLLQARHAGAQVCVSIRDDGRGLDCARIRARAEERGLVTPEQVLGEQEIFQLIFEPGFSTATEVTSLSGRGVGMDVVKRTIEALRGTIEISSSPGLGTEVTLCLPLTLAIIDGLLVRVGQGRYVIPLTAVEECVELEGETPSSGSRSSFLNLRGSLIPFLRLAELFQTPADADPLKKVVIVSTGDQRVGLVVDQVIGDHQTVIKSMSKLHADIDIFSGATILGDGSVALILDIAPLVAFGQAHEDRLVPVR